MTSVHDSESSSDLEYDGNQSFLSQLGEAPFQSYPSSPILPNETSPVPGGVSGVFGQPLQAAAAAPPPPPPPPPFIETIIGMRQHLFGLHNQPDIYGDVPDLNNDKLRLWRAIYKSRDKTVSNHLRFIPVCFGISNGMLSV